jgi:lipoprotein-anchoring transpeptidase ErfK/SrfK
MVLRVTAAAALIGLALVFDLGVPGNLAHAQYYPPPPGTYPAQPYPSQGRQLPPPVQADEDDDVDDLGPPRTFGFPAPPRPPQGVQQGMQYGGRPVYPPEADTYAPPPPPYGNPNGGPQGYGQPADAGPRAPMSIGPSAPVTALPPDYQPETGPAQLPPQFRRTIIDFRTKEPAGTIIIDTPNTYLYLVLGNGKAMRYGIGVGREGFTWSGVQNITKKAEWPDWTPPAEMLERQPYLPRFMAGGPGNPLGARAMYLGGSIYRIHGTNDPSTIGHRVSSGCIRLTNDDVSDLYSRVNLGTKVVVLPMTEQRASAGSGAIY